MRRFIMIPTHFLWNTEITSSMPGANKFIFIWGILFLLTRWLNQCGGIALWNTHSHFPLVLQAGNGSVSGKEGLQGTTQRQPLSLWLLLWSGCTSSQDFQAFVEGVTERGIWGIDEITLAGARLEGRGKKCVSVCMCEGVWEWTPACMCFVGAGCVVFLAVLLWVAGPQREQLSRIWDCGETS